MVSRRQWLGRLPAAQYESLFKESLTEATMSSIVGCVHDAILPGGAGGEADGSAGGFALEVLKGLGSTRRFGMLLMFLDERPKAAVRRIFKALQGTGQGASTSLQQKWEVK